MRFQKPEIKKNKYFWVDKCTKFCLNEDTQPNEYQEVLRSSRDSQSFFSCLWNWSEVNFSAMKLLVTLFLAASIACVFASTAEEEWAAFKVNCFY